MTLTAEGKAVQTLFYIQDKYTRKKVPFIANRAQQFFERHEANKMIIAKARQKGFSSWILAKYAIRCLGIEGTRAVVMSHEGESTQKLLNKIDYYIKHMNGPQPAFGRHSRNEMFFSKMDSELYIGTAGARAFGRGDTISNLHCSEYAWWENPEKHHTGAFQAVPMTGQIILESTGNGRANDFYFIWKNADRMGYTRLFYPWYADTEYSLDVKGTWSPTIPGLTGHLLDLRDKHKLSDRQMTWYEMKLKELREDLRMMNQEYPSDPEDCFQATGGACFTNVVIQSNPLWKEDEKLFGYYVGRLGNHPQPTFHYIIGGDPSGGTGNDDAALQVFCAETGEQVLALANNTIQPIRFGELLCQFGTLYNDAYIVCEGNNHGIAVNEHLKRHYKKHLLFKRRPATKTQPGEYGWLNTQQNKHMLIDTMKEALGSYILYDHKTGTELQAFEETEEGKMSGPSDNTVIASGLAILGLQRYAHYRDAHLIQEVEEVKVNNLGWHYTFEELVKDRYPKLNFFGEVNRTRH